MALSSFSMQYRFILYLHESYSLKIKLYCFLVLFPVNRFHPIPLLLSPLFLTKFSFLILLSLFYIFALFQKISRICNVTNQLVTLLKVFINNKNTNWILLFLLLLKPIYSVWTVSPIFNPPKHPICLFSKINLSITLIFTIKYRRILRNFFFCPKIIDSCVTLDL